MKDYLIIWKKEKKNLEEKEILNNGKKKYPYDFVPR